MVFGTPRKGLIEITNNNFEVNIKDWDTCLSRCKLNPECTTVSYTESYDNNSMCEWGKAYSIGENIETDMIYSIRPELTPTKKIILADLLSTKKFAAEQTAYALLDTDNMSGTQRDDALDKSLIFKTLHTQITQLIDELLEDNTDTDYIKYKMEDAYEKTIGYAKDINESKYTIAEINDVITHDVEQQPPPQKNDKMFAIAVLVLVLFGCICFFHQ